MERVSVLVGVGLVGSGCDGDADEVGVRFLRPSTGSGCTPVGMTAIGWVVEMVVSAVADLQN